MNTIVFVMRRLITTLMLVVALSSGGVLGLYKMRVDVPQINTPKIYASLDRVGVRAKRMYGSILRRVQSYFRGHHEESHHEERKVVVTSPNAMDVVITQRYVCQIHSKRHIDVCAMDRGYLEKISVTEGQAVKKGESMFTILPVLYKARYDAEKAEALLAQRELNNTRQLYNQKLSGNQNLSVVSLNEVLLFEAKLARAQAKAELAEAELKFTDVTAPFDGIVDRQHEQLGSLIKEGDILTTLSDNSVMWVYFNVPERDYLEYMAHRKQHEAEDKIELQLADGNKFPQPGKIGTIEAQFNNETGNIPFRADFPNPDSVLRHGQTGTIRISRTLKNALVIPQRAIFEILDKRYVWVVGDDDVAHQRLITIKHELEDIFVINSELNAGDKIVLEGVRQVEEGGKVEYEFRKPEEALKNQKFHAE